MKIKGYWNVPNILGFYRLLAFPFILWFALSGRQGLFAIFLVLNLFTDIADGYIASRFKLETEFGARLDSLAGIIGMSLHKRSNEIRLFGINPGKTWMGSLSFLVSSFIICIIVLYHKQLSIDLKLFSLAFLASLSGTIAELLSRKGTDNLFIPLSVMAVLIIFT